MESEQLAYLRILESVSRERDLFRQEARHHRDNDHRSEQAAQVSTEEVEYLTVQLIEARTTSEYFHDVHGRNLVESHRIAAEGDREWSKDDRFLREIKKRKRRARRGRRQSSNAIRKRWTLRAFSKMILLGQILAGQYHLPVTRPCQLHGKKLRVYPCVLTQEDTLLPNAWEDLMRFF